MSAHADSLEIMRWLSGFRRPPRTTFIVHGELTAMEALESADPDQAGLDDKDPRASGKSV